MRSDSSDVAVDAVADHPVALDELANAVIEAEFRRVSGAFDLRIGNDVVAFVGILADWRFEIDEARYLRLDPLAQLRLRNIGVRQADVIGPALHLVEIVDRMNEGTRDVVIRQFAHDYVTDDVISCLTPSPIDLANYRDVVLERFGNPAIRDTNQRVAMDGFSKIPGFIAPTIRERLAKDESIASVAMLPALFLAFLQRWHHGQIPYVYQDQGMDVAAAHRICDAPDPVVAFCGDKVLWGPQAGDARLITALRAARLRVDKFIKEQQK